ILQRDIVDDLVVGALEEGRVDRANGLDAFGGETGGEEDGVFLGDADVEELFRSRGGEVREAGAAGHRAGDTDYAGVLFGETSERVAEDVLVGGRSLSGRLGAFAGDGIEGAGAVEFFGVADG